MRGFKKKKKKKKKKRGLMVGLLISEPNSDGQIICFIA